MSEKNKNNFHIKITQGMEHHSNRMDIYDKGEFFYDSYRQAAYAITRIVEISRLEFEERKKQKDCHNYRRNFEYHNNIVAFCADRGQGKTSAMISMSDALRNMSAEKNGRIDKDKEREKRDFWTNAYDFIPDSSNPSSNPVLDTHFECLPIIDPTCLEKNDSILRTVISRMFQSASQKWQDSSNCSSSMYRNAGKEKQRQKEELANKFLKCFKGLDYLYKEEKKEISSYYDDLNMVAEYGDSNNFKTMFMDLVESYLQFISFSSSDPCYSDTKNTMMVILIDDADLNTKRAFSIVEEIQKYFVIPGVLILMALHVGTLARTLEQNQLEQYKTLINYSNDPTIKERCHRAMERYVEKLFPSSHRIYLPEISKVIEQGYKKDVRLYYYDKDNNDVFEKYKYLAKRKFEDNYEERLFLLIYVKTGIILARQGHHLHEFLPNNFRQLNHFLFCLNSMDDIVTEENINNGCLSPFQNILANRRKYRPDMLHSGSSSIVYLWIKNLNIFKNYLLNSWCPARLTSQQLRIIENIEQIPSNIKNFNTVQMIKKIINDDEDKIGENISDIREQTITDSRYTPLSDVIWALYRLQHTINPVNYFAFIYAVKMYYTIHLHMTALFGILDLLEPSRRIEYSEQSDEFTPLNKLFDVLGGRIFPMHYYMKKRLPFYISGIKKKNLKGFYSGTVDILRRFTYKCEISKIKTGISAASLYDVYNFLNFDNLQNYCVNFRECPINEKTNEVSSYMFFDFVAPITALFRTENINGMWTSLHFPYIDSEAFYSVFNLICNIDLQEIIYRNYFKEPYTTRNRPTGNLLEIANGIYAIFDTIIENNIIVGVKSHLKNLIVDFDLESIEQQFNIIGNQIGDIRLWKNIDDFTDDLDGIVVLPDLDSDYTSKGVFNKSDNQTNNSDTQKQESNSETPQKTEGENKERFVNRFMGEIMDKIMGKEKEKTEKNNADE